MTARFKRIIYPPRRLIGLLIPINLLLLSGHVWLEIIGCGVFDPVSSISMIQMGFLLGGVGFAILGTLLLYHRPENRIAWLTASLGSLILLGIFLSNLNDCGMAGNIAVPALPHLVWVENILSPYIFAMILNLLPMVFPDGRFLSRGWRTLTIIGYGVLTASIMINSLIPGEMLNESPNRPLLPENPFGIKALPGASLQRVMFQMQLILIGYLALIAILSMVFRWRNAQEREKQQLKWFVYFLSTAVLIQIVVFEGLGRWWLFPDIYDTVWYGLINMIVFTGFPITIGIAIFKYRLYDIDLIIRRTLSYALLTGILLLVYFGGVVILQSIFLVLSGNPDSRAITVLSTLGIAGLFNPLRGRIQGFIDRRFYREEYDGQRTLQRFANATRDEVNLDRLTGELLSVVAETLKPEQAKLLIKKTKEGER